MVFIVGAGRSGTKYLRGLLSISPVVGVIPYDVSYIWRYGNESCPHDEFTTEMLNPKIEKYIKNKLPGLMERRNKERAKILIEKTVPNSLRPNYVRAIFPEAKFIHLVRDGRAVTESSIRMWKEPPQRGYLIDKIKYFPLSNYRYALWYLGNVAKGMMSKGRGQAIWGPRYRGIYEDLANLPLEVICARQWRKCVEVAAEQLGCIPQDQVLDVQYEKLMESEDEVRRICDFIGIPADEIIKKYLDTRVVGNADKWKDVLEKNVLDQISHELMPALKRFKYLEN